MEKDDFSVTFSSDILNRLEEMAFLNVILAAAKNDGEAEQLTNFVRAFTKRGVPARTVFEAMIELAKGGGFEDGKRTAAD